MGINKLHNSISLTGDAVWIEDRNIQIRNICATTRVGINYAEEYIDKPWRYYIEGNKWVSRISSLTK